MPQGGNFFGLAIREKNILIYDSHIPTTTESTTTTTFAGKPSSSQFHRLQQQQQQQLDQELLVNPVVELPIWLEGGEVDRATAAQGKESKSYVTTTALLLRAQALLMKEIETSSHQVSISSTLYARGFGSFFYLHVRRKSCQNNVRTKNARV